MSCHLRTKHIVKMKCNVLKIIYIILILHNSYVLCKNYDHLIVGDFFHLKNIKNGIVFRCGSQNGKYVFNIFIKIKIKFTYSAEIVDFAKQLSKFNYLNLLYENIDETQYENGTHIKYVFQRFTKTMSYHYGIILNDNCINSFNILQVVRKKYVNIFFKIIIFI